MMLEIGIKGSAEARVTLDNSAVNMGSGDCPVFATPAMVALMEEAAGRSVSEHLNDGETTVGVSLNIRHTAATALGRVVRAESELIEIDGRRLVFKVTAFDEVGEIGGGEHARAIVNREKFLARAQQRGL
jgi:fluoroacetyl-CoA thioesterase